VKPLFAEKGEQAMFEPLADTLLILTGYALGCLTTGYYIVRHLAGSDVRNSGSGSVGATNVGRQLGRQGFMLTFAGDIVKGALALLLAKWSGCSDLGLALVLLAVVCGHIWPVQLKFKGGKGVSTTLGGLIIYDPVLMLLLVGLFLPVYLISRDRELSGIIIFPVVPLATLFLGRPLVTTTACLALALLLLWTHRDNLAMICRHGGTREC
jgi:glycerol-3-phosphate acyltransferase PlsY